MKMCLFACFLAVQYFFTSIVSDEVDVLYVRKDKGIRVLELWNLSNLYCGKFDNDHAYRNDYIDYVSPDCIRMLTVRIYKSEKDQLTLEYKSINSMNLKNILRRKPDSATWKNSPRVPLSTDKYLVNKGNYEFLWTNDVGNRIYAAMYYNSEESSTPKFYYSEKNDGDTYDYPGDVGSPSGMKNVDEVRISITLKDDDECDEDDEDDFDHSNHMNKCPAAPEESISQYEFEVGGNIQLPCPSVAYNFITDVEWTTDSECGLADEIIGLIFNPDLKIYNAKTCDSGNYQCCVTYSLGLTISTVCGNNISVGYKPIVEVITDPIEVLYQTQHTIECRVKAFPHITAVEWNITTETGTIFFSSHENNLGKHFVFSFTSPSLDILSTDFTDTGQYICTAENIFGKSSSTVVYIQVYGISLTVSSTLYTIVYGNDVELECNVTGRPDITNVTWSMQKETEAHQIDVTNILKYNGATLSVPSLTIFNVTFEDDGIYFCEAGNSYEIRTSQEVALTVTSDPTSTTPTRTQNPGSTSPSATSITTQNPGTTSPSTTSTTTQNPGTKSPSTTSTTTQNPRTTSTSTTTSTTTQNSGTTSPSTTSTTNQNPGTTSTSTTTSTKTQNPGKPSVSTTLTTPTTTTKPEAISCQCPCSSLGIWARRDLSNYTIDELLEMLAPQLAKTEKELSVDKSNLSATINKRISAKDERKSSQSIGILGIVFIFSVIFGVVIIDLMSIMRFMKPKLKTGKTDTSEPEGRSE